jgi:hypothetical protein
VTAFGVALTVINADYKFAAFCAADRRQIRRPNLRNFDAIDERRTAKDQLNGRNGAICRRKQAFRRAMPA